MTSDRVIKPVSEWAAEAISGKDYVAPSVKADAASGDAEAQAEVQDAKANNQATTDPLMTEEIPDFGETK